MFCPNCGYKNEDNASFCVSCGNTLGGSLQDGRYKLKKVLGHGGMGHVFLAWDEKMDAHIVIKQLKLPRDEKPDVKDYLKNRMLEEGKLLYRLSHKNLPKVMDYFIEDENMFLAMQLVDGRNLNDLLLEQEKGRIPVDQALNWMVEMLDVLSFLHGQDPPIIHRDIKPQNIMIDQRGNLYLVDFGIARSIGMETSHTQVGTFGYASPEHYTGKFNVTSDIYSLGATFYHLITGLSPRERSHPESFPPIAKYIPGFPDSLQKIFDKMLAISSKNRYQDCDEILRDLETVEALEGLDKEKIKKALPPVVEKADTADMESKDTKDMEEKEESKETADMPRETREQKEEPSGKKAGPVKKKKDRNLMVIAGVVGGILIFSVIFIGVAVLFYNYLKKSNSEFLPNFKKPKKTAAPTATSTTPFKASPTPTATATSTSPGETPTPETTKTPSNWDRYVFNKGTRSLVRTLSSRYPGMRDGEFYQFNLNGKGPNDWIVFYNKRSFNYVDIFTSSRDGYKRIKNQSMEMAEGYAEIKMVNLAGNDKRQILAKAVINRRPAAYTTYAVYYSDGYHIVNLGSVLTNRFNIPYMVKNMDGTTPFEILAVDSETLGKTADMEQGVRRIYRWKNGRLNDVSPEFPNYYRKVVDRYSGMLESTVNNIKGRDRIYTDLIVKNIVTAWKLGNLKYSRLDPVETVERYAGAQKNKDFVRAYVLQSKYSRKRSESFKKYYESNMKSKNTYHYSNFHLKKKSGNKAIVGTTIRITNSSGYDNTNKYVVELVKENGLWRINRWGIENSEWF